MEDLAQCFSTLFFRLLFIYLFICFMRGFFVVVVVVVVLQFYFIFKLYIIVLVLPNIKMNPPQVYMCSPSWIRLLFKSNCLLLPWNSIFNKYIYTVYLWLNALVYMCMCVDAHTIFFTLRNQLLSPVKLRIISLFLGEDT